MHIIPISILVALKFQLMLKHATEPLWLFNTVELLILSLRLSEIFICLRGCHKKTAQTKVGSLGGLKDNMNS